MCSSNRWNTSHLADMRSQSHMSEYSVAVRYTVLEVGEAPDCDGHSWEEEVVHCAGLEGVVLGSGTQEEEEEGLDEMEEGQ